MLIHLEAGFQEQMAGRMPVGIGWEDMTRWWGRRVRWGGMEVYGMIIEIWEGLAMKSAASSYNYS